METNRQENTNEQDFVLEVEQALFEDKQKRQEQRKREIEEQEKAVGRLAMLPHLLRVIGAIVLLTAAGTFMLQGWDTMSHLFRYFSFLGFTALLGAAGFFCGLKVKEDKGARTFLAVAAAIMPAHFCQLGALIFSKFGSGVLPSYPAYAHWVAGTGVDALITTVVAIVILTPICFIAFSALARTEALNLTAIYITLNSLLLVPTREANVIGVIGLIGLTSVVLLDSKLFSADAAMKTKEGILVRTMMFVPVILLYLRSMHLYDTTYLFVSTIYAAIAVCLFVFSPLYFKKSTASVLQALSTIPASVSWVMLVNQFDRTFGIADSLTLPAITIPLALILVLMSVYSVSKGTGYQKSAAILAVGGALLELAAFPGISAAIFCVVIGISSVAYGYMVESKFVFFGGIFSFGYGLLYSIKLAVSVITISPWLGLAIIGALTILGSSYLEVHVRSVVQHIGNFRKQISAWS